MRRNSKASVRKKKTPPVAKEPADFGDYLEMLEKPKWLQQIFVAQDGYSPLDLAKLYSHYFLDLRTHNRHLARENDLMKTELKQIRDKAWGDLDDDTKLAIIRERANHFVKIEVDRYQETNVSLRRELQQMRAALERGLCERG